MHEKKEEGDQVVLVVDQYGDATDLGILDALCCKCETICD